MSLDSSLQLGQSRADFLRIAAGVRSFHSLGCIQHTAVMFRQLNGWRTRATLHALAVEGFIQRLAESIPELLLMLAIQRHALRFGLPALLQRLDCIDTQIGRRTQCIGFFNHGVTEIQAGFLRSVQRRLGSRHGLLEQWLQLGK